MKTPRSIMKKQSKQDVINKLNALEGITLQMYRLLDSLEKTNALDNQISPLVEMAMNDYINYIKEQV